MAKKKRQRTGKQASARRRRVRGINSRVDEIKVGGALIRQTDLGDALVEMPTIERSIESASIVTIKLHDPAQRLLASKLLQERTDLSLDGLHFRLMAAQKDGDLLTLQFIDRLVAYMKKYDKAMKGYRDQMTRAEFIYKQVREVREERIPVYILELHKEQPIENSEQATKAKLVSLESRGKGLDSGAKLTVKGVPANPEQIRNGDTVLRVGASLNAPRLAMVACIMAGIQENNMMNNGDGFFQMLPSTQELYGIPASDLAAAAKQAYTEGFYQAGLIESIEKGLSPGAAAQAMEGSAHPTLYDQWRGEAEEWVDAFAGGGISGGTISSTIEKRYAFERREGEDAWVNTGKLATEVAWRRFASAGVFYLGAEEDFRRSEIRMRIGSDTEGIENVNFGWNAYKKANEVTISAKVKDWWGPPGSVIYLDEEFGPGQGRYLIKRITTGVDSELADITASKAEHSLPEPAPETVERTTEFGDDGSGVSGDAGSPKGITIPSANPGDPDWGGAYYVFQQFVHPFMKANGLSPGSQKRSNNTGSGTSDHWTGSTQAYATDYPTYSGEGIARKLASVMGFGSWQPNSYATFKITVDGYSFVVQILWGAGIDHGDHIHVGMHRA